MIGSRLWRIIKNFSLSGFGLALKQEIELDKILEAIQKMREDISQQIEYVRCHISSSSDESRGQQTQIKDRISWLIKQYDAMERIVNKLEKTVSKLNSDIEKSRVTKNGNGS